MIDIINHIKIHRWYQRMFIITAIVIGIGSCKEKFFADLPSPATGYLIVEGIINVGNQVTTVISLSRTSTLDSREIQYEEDARVFIEDQQNNQYELQHSDSGKYRSAVMDLPVNRQYRLHILSDNKEYYSAFAETKISPEIDSLFWVPKDDGIEIQLSTHDPQDLSRYYYWNFVETWEYSAPYYSVVKYDQTGRKLVQRNPSEMIYNCWMSMPSSSIVVGSTAKLSKDLVYAKPIAFVSATGTNKLVKKYSIIVRQSVLTKEAYEYLDRMRKNTEQTGSVFDAQPSQLRGNITCSEDSSETVVGFVTTSSITEKRIFISRAELPPLNIKTFYEQCYLEQIPNNSDTIIAQFSNGSYIPVDTIINFGVTYAITYAYNLCVDCRRLGGTLTKPSFWP